MIKKVEDIKKVIISENVQIMLVSDKMNVASTNMLYLHFTLTHTRSKSKNQETRLSGLHANSLWGKKKQKYENFDAISRKRDDKFLKGTEVFVLRF